MLRRVIGKIPKTSRGIILCMNQSTSPLRPDNFRLLELLHPSELRGTL